MWIVTLLLLSLNSVRFSVEALQTSTNNYKYGRTYMVSHQPQNWTEAHNRCVRKGGQLALIHELTTVPDMEIQENGTFWVGIRWNGTTLGNKMWSNWVSQPVLANASILCALVTIEPPYWWYATNCSSQHPYICEIQNGSCTYTYIKASALRGLNRAFRSAVTLNQCKQICTDSSLGFTCKSFEHNTKYNYCQFSEWNRWTAPGYFGSDREMDYYHRTCCNTVLMKEDVPDTTTQLDTSSLSDDTTVPLETSSDIFSGTPDIIDTSSTPVISSSYPDVSRSQILLCTQIWVDDRSSIVSATFSSELLSSSVTPVTVPPSASANFIENLQDLSKDIKKRKSLLKKISVPDYRASSISIGTLATIILVGLMIAIIAMDAPILGRHCVIMHRTLCPHCCSCPGPAKDETSSPLDSPKIIIATVGKGVKPLPKRFEPMAGEPSRVLCGENPPRDDTILGLNTSSVTEPVLSEPLPKRFDPMPGEPSPVLCGENPPRDDAMLGQRGSSVTKPILHVPINSTPKKEMTHL